MIGLGIARWVGWEVFLRIRDLLGYTVYTILVWLVGGGGNTGIMDEFIDRVRGWEEA